MDSTSLSPSALFDVVAAGGTAGTRGQPLLQTLAVETVAAFDPHCEFPRSHFPQTDGAIFSLLQLFFAEQQLHVSLLQSSRDAHVLNFGAVSAVGVDDPHACVGGPHLSLCLHDEFPHPVEEFSAEVG